MLSRFRAAGLVWPALLALPALVLLVALGNWQLSRKAWKEALIAQIEAGISAEPVALDQGLKGEPCTTGATCRFSEYTRVRVRGRFEHDRERYFYAPDPGLGPGVHVYTPLALEDGRRIVINRGFVPDQLRPPATREAGQLRGIVEIVGLLRGPGSKAMFTPANDPARNAWYWRDIDAMADCGPQATAGQAERCRSFVRAFIDAEAVPATPGGWPRGGATNLQIYNRHLEYALTWYGLAVALVGILAAFARGRLRKSGPASAGR